MNISYENPDYSGELYQKLQIAIISNEDEIYNSVRNCKLKYYSVEIIKRKLHTVKQSVKL